MPPPYLLRIYSARGGNRAANCFDSKKAPPPLFAPEDLIFRPLA